MAIRGRTNSSLWLLPPHALCLSESTDYSLPFFSSYLVQFTSRFPLSPTHDYAAKFALSLHYQNFPHSVKSQFQISRSFNKRLDCMGAWQRKDKEMVSNSTPENTALISWEISGLQCFSLPSRPCSDHDRVLDFRKLRLFFHFDASALQGKFEP